MLKQEKIINPDLVFMGFLATESKKRLKRAQKWNYLKLSYSENVCIPLAMLKESEVFELMDELSIPYLKEAYFINKINTFCGGDGTCWMCSDSCFEKNLGGNWKLIKENFPSLWKKINEEYSFKEKLFELYKKTKNKKIKQTYNDLFKKHNS